MLKFLPPPLQISVPLFVFLLFTPFVSSTLRGINQLIRPEVKYSVTGNGKDISSKHKVK